MNNETKLNGALCADRGAADAMQAAPAEGKRKYVPPRMQVIPLSPQRMLATSGVSGPPVKVALTLHAVDYYFSDNCGNSFEKSGSLDRVGCASFVNGTFDADWTAIKAGYPGLISAWQADPEHGNVGGSCHGCALTSTAPACLWQPGEDTILPFEDVVMSSSLVRRVTFDGADWTAADFLAGATFLTCGTGGSFSGTYDGRNFEGKISYYSL